MMALRQPQRPKDAISFRSRPILSVFHLLYGLRLQANFPLAGLPIKSNLRVIDVRVHLKDKSVFLSAIPPFQNETLYVSSDRDGDSDDPGRPNLRVSTLAGGQCVGFFYRDGA
jgi:hypothetical protein